MLAPMQQFLRGIQEMQKAWLQPLLEEHLQRKAQMLAVGQQFSNQLVELLDRFKRLETSLPPQTRLAEDIRALAKAPLFPVENLPPGPAGELAQEIDQRREQAWAADRFLVLDFGHRGCLFLERVVAKNSFLLEFHGFDPDGTPRVVLGSALAPDWSSYEVPLSELEKKPSRRVGFCPGPTEDETP